MFDFLDGVDSTDVLAATAYAIRMLTHRGGSRLPPQSLALPDEFSSRQRRLGNRIVADVEAAEGEPIERLDRLQVRRHVGDLYSRVEKLWGSSAESVAEAQRVLAQFRNGTVG